VRGSQRRLHVTRHLAQVAYQHCRAHESGGEGLCMVVAASLGWALRTRHDIATQAIAGDFDGEPHWWLLMDGVRIDPTRHQFEDTHELLYPVADEHPGRYLDRYTWPSAWTREQAMAEGARVFIDPDYGRTWVSELADALLNASSDAALSSSSAVALLPAAGAAAPVKALPVSSPSSK